MRRATPAASIAFCAAGLLLLAASTAHATGDGDGFVATLWNDWSLPQALEANGMAERVGACQISYLVHMRQADKRATSVRWLGTRDGTPFDAAPAAVVLRGAIADARSRGLSVTLVPFLLADDHSARHWFWPRDRAAWFRSYSARMVELARFAEAEGVTEMLVASELSRLYRAADGWRRVIRALRPHFTGHLTISCLFFEYPTIRFWPELDSIGVSAYFPLAVLSFTRSTAVFERMWRVHRAHLVAFARVYGKPITFAELGYPATRVAARMPWDYSWAKRRKDTRLQARCFEAFRRVWAHEPRLRRFSIWGLEPARFDQRGTGGKGFLPIGKPAEQTVRRLFREREIAP